MVEEDAVAGEQAVGLAVLDRHLVGEDLGHGVGAARVEGGGFALGRLLDLAVHLGAAGLVEARVPVGVAERFEQAQVAHGRRTSAVYSGMSKLTATWLWAPRL